MDIAGRKLTESDFQSLVWERLRAEIERQLADLRLQNDGKNLNDVDTAYLRGQIAECKRLLGLAEPKPKIPNSAGARY